MNIVHICNNYYSSAVHFELVKHLANSDVSQIIITPVAKGRNASNDKIDSSNIRCHQFFYPAFLKFLPLIKCLFNSYMSFKILSRYELSSKKVHLIGHTLWSDGFVCWILSNYLKSEYYVSVRNTDLNMFLPISKFLPHISFFLGRIVKNSSKLIFINEVYRNRVQQNWRSLYSKARQVEVVPNGLNSFWLENILKNDVYRPEHAVFIGKYEPNKNLKNVIKASSRIYQNNKNFRLHLVGGNEKELMAEIGFPIPEFVINHGFISDRSILSKLLRQVRVLVVPSIHETFGLVYIEALSQGCPVIHSIDEGIHGMIDSDVSRAVNPHDVNNIQSELETLMKRFENGIHSNRIKLLIECFSWEKIQLSYLN